MYLFIYYFTAATAADRPSLSARAAKREEKEIDQLEHGLLKWKVCALCELKVVMKWSFRNQLTILIFDNGGLGERSMRSLGNEFHSQTTRLK